MPVLEADDELAVVDCADGAAPGLGHPLLAALISRNALTVRAKLGWTDVARFAAHGIPAANFGPGDATLAHTAQRAGRPRARSSGPTRPWRTSSAPAPERRRPVEPARSLRGRASAEADHSRRSTVTTLP